MLSGSHIETFLYVGLLVLLLYFPPRRWAGAGAFLERHYGDSVGFFVLLLGVALAIAGDVHHIGSAQQIGNSLVVAAMAVLKLKSNGPPPAPPVVPTSAPTPAGPTPPADWPKP